MRALAVVVLAGCSFSTTVGGEPGVTGDGAPADAPREIPPEGACGTAGAIRDDFADGVIAPIWGVTNRSETVEAAGTLAVTPSGTAFAGYQATPYVDLRAAAAEVELRSITGTGATAHFRFTHDNGLFGFTVSTDTLTMGVAPGGLATLPYDPAQHRHLRVAHAGDDLTFSTSPDGLVWTPRHTTPAPPFVSAVSIGLGATGSVVAVSPSTVTFAAFNTYVAPAKWCAANTLVDNFDDSMIDLPWAHHGHTTAGCIEYENQFAARVDQNGSMACDAYFGSSALYRLTGTQMVARIAAITTFATGWITYLGVWDVDEQNYARMFFEGNQLCVDGTNLAKTCVAYSTQRDLWRVREADGMLHFEAGMGSSFTAVHSVPVPFPLDAVRIYFGTLTDRATGQNIGLNVDRFN